MSEYYQPTCLSTYLGRSIALKRKESRREPEEQEILHFFLFFLSPLSSVLFSSILFLPPDPHPPSPLFIPIRPSSRLPTLSHDPLSTGFYSSLYPPVRHPYPPRPGKASKQKPERRTLGKTNQPARRSRPDSLDRKPIDSCTVLRR